ncbi:MAG: glycosyltransferase family protein, partial [Alphaproteobacteria bacterium]
LSDLPYDGQFLGTGTGKREEQLQALMAALPADYRFNCGGLAFGSERLVSTRFLAALTQGAVCPNLPIDDSDLDQIDPLYSSDRIAQTLGQGVTTLVHERSELTRLYEDGIVTYQSRDDLVEQMLALKGDDARRRVVGAKGRALAHERTNVTLVAAYMLAAGLGETLPEIFWDAAPV